MKILFATLTAALLASGAQAATTGLTGTSMTVQVQFQPNEAAARQVISFSDTAVVKDGVEFPNLADLDIGSNPFNLFVVPVAVDVGDDFIELDYSIGGSGAFAPGFFNGYLFQFDGGVPIEFRNASIDESVTTLAVTNDDLQFIGNQLFLDVSSRSFSSSSFVRISADAVSTVPVPASLVLFLTGLGGLGIVSRSRRFASGD